MLSLLSFHVSLLKHYEGSLDHTPVEDPQLKAKEEDDVIIPQQLIYHQDKHTRGGYFAGKYLLKFLHYPTVNAKWADNKYLSNYPHFIHLYEEALQLNTCAYFSFSEDIGFYNNRECVTMATLLTYF